MLHAVNDSLFTAAANDTAAAYLPQDRAGSDGTHYRLTPYQVLRRLPKDATPAQQDSAIQAWFQPGEIHYSSQPDTLHLPGYGRGRKMSDVDLPQYYRENFFSANSLLHPEAEGGRYGVAGDPVPYSIRSDNTFSMLLLLSFVLFVVSLSGSRRFIGRQLKSLIFSSGNTPVMRETAIELRFQLFLVLLASLLLAIATYIIATPEPTDTFVLDTQFQVVMLFFVLFTAFFSLRTGLQHAVNKVFFDDKLNLQWLLSQLFVTASLGILLFPVVMLQVYFDIDTQNVIYCILFVVITAEILAFYKCWTIFFRQIGNYLQIILYFCALELLPMAIFGSTLVVIIERLKINF